MGMAKKRHLLLLLVLGVCSVAACRWNLCTESGVEKQRVQDKMAVKKSFYGKTQEGEEVQLYSLTNANGLRAKLITFGAILASLEVPDRNGELGDITLGYDSLEGWVKDPSYFGATVGRYANRIAKGRFSLDGETFTLATNNGPNHLHGGIKGFNKVIWKAEEMKSPYGVGVKFTLLSKDREEGYPGTLRATVVYTLTNDNELKIEYTATTDKPTIVNITHHSYWNLGGAQSGDILGHELMLNADFYLPVDEGLIPTGELKPVKSTPMDFTRPLAIGARIAEVQGGYDHNWVLRGQEGKLTPAARVYEPKTGRVMEIHTTEPGMQFYSGNFLNGRIKGKGGVTYKKHHGFCLETQHYPDSPNKPHFPSVVLRPGQIYKHLTVHRFSSG